MVGITGGSNMIYKLFVLRFVLAKYRKQARESGTFAAARNLRKQGYPIEIARAILL